MIEHGLASGEISLEEVDRIDSGFHENYMSGGSIAIDKDRLRLLNGYRVLLRLMSILPPRAKKALLRWKAYKVFWMAPFRLFISLLDLAIAIRDRDATTYCKNYWWWFKKRFDKNYHLYYFKKITKRPIVTKTFELPADGVLGTRTSLGYHPPPKYQSKANDSNRAVA